MAWSKILVSLLLAAGTAVALPPISQKGRYFFTADGNRFFIKGVAYQLYSTGPSTDPFVDAGQCQRDASLMKQLGVNAIRTYHVRPLLNHDDCMRIFDEAGIYLFVDLDDYPTQFDQGNPGYSNFQKLGFEQVVDAFAKYENTAGFFIGNEVITEGAKTGIAPYIKSAVRDMKDYMAAKGYRKIPIGYSHADVQSIGQNLEYYMACGGEDGGMLDFYGLNSYRWCGDQTFQGSGYIDILAQTKDYPIPIFMSETGCIVPEPRLFQDQRSLLGPDMDDVWSGAIVYEWLQEENHYGLVTYENGLTDALNTVAAPANGWPRSGTPTPVTPDFANLSNIWKTLSPTGVQAAAYTPTLSPLACPSYQPNSWQVSGDAPLPAATGASTLGSLGTFSTQASPPLSSVVIASSVASSSSIVVQPTMQSSQPLITSAIVSSTSVMTDSSTISVSATVAPTPTSGSSITSGTSSGSAVEAGVSASTTSRLSTSTTSTSASQSSHTGAANTLHSISSMWSLLFMGLGLPALV